MSEIVDTIEQQLPQLNRYAVSLTRNRASADDLVQDCVERALEKRHLYREGTNARAWLFTLMRNVHINGLRREGRRGASVELDDAAGASATRPNQATSVMLRSVVRALKTVPANQRAPLVLHGLHEFSYKEISARLGIPVGTVKSRVARGRKSLRTELGEAEGQGLHAA